MNLYDNENKIIESFQKIKSDEILLVSENNNNEKILQSIYNKENWKYWINSSGKSDLPPDFYSNEFELIMNIMRVDNHAYKNSKGQIINPTLQMESKIYKEIMESKIVKDINFKGDINVIARTDLPSDEDHNYKYYLENFKRIVNKHNDKIENYKRNHPKFKSIFFAFDESSGYINTKRKQNTRMVGQEVKAKIHFWFMDKEFLNIIKELKIDYFIWYAPYKYYIGINPKILPKVCIYNLKEINKINLIEYDMDTMISSEI